MNSYVITIGRYFNARIDAIGVALSALCGLHCAAMPALIASGLLLSNGSETAHDYTHYLLFATAGPVTLLAIWRVIRHRHPTWVIVVGGLGLLALWLGLSRDSHDLPATLTTLTGATLLMVFHLHHWRLHRHSHAPGEARGDDHRHVHRHVHGHIHGKKGDSAAH